MRLTLIIIFGAIAIFFAIGFAGTSSPEGKEIAQTRSAIALCWEDQAKKSNTPDQARFIAGACEMMEDKLRKQHNVKP